MFIIPKTLCLGGQKISIKESGLIGNDTSCDGMAIYQDQLIEISKNIKGDYKEFVFFHELTHHILNQMGEVKLRSDEKFVNQFAAFLHQAIKTMK